MVRIVIGFLAIGGIALLFILWCCVKVGSYPEPKPQKKEFRENKKRVPQNHHVDD